jgi:hypothetical protein
VICRAANTLWLAGCVPEAARFRSAMTRVADEQARVLRRLLRHNEASEFGRRHGFSTISSVREYQQRVPLLTYDDYRASIDRLAEGCASVLTSEPVRLLEPTSGSAGAQKLVPYTVTLQREFQRGIRPWIADLYLHHPALMGGSAYWSVSPSAASRTRTAGGIPIGFEDDACYVGAWQRRLIAAAMAVPAAVRHIVDIELFRYQTLLALVRSADLRLVSVWNPTFLTLLVDRLPEWGDALARALDAHRASTLRTALGARTAGERHAVLWPHLHTISCWTDANAAVPAAHVAGLFPHARIQGKGLIATEAFISLPLVGHDGAAVAVRSHFLEFASVNGQNEMCDREPRLAHELERGRRYAVIVSTGGGLYRYHLHDLVEVVGHIGECPLIRFVGRQGYVSDWFGEKLNEAFVAQVLRETFDEFSISASFAMLACDNTRSTPAYTLYIDTTTADDLLERVASGIDSRLRDSFHYDYARRLGQLAALRVFRAEAAGDAYLNAAVRSGQRVGDVKSLALDGRTGWSQILPGRFIRGGLNPSINHPITG